jgi:hypothetical protein
VRHRFPDLEVEFIVKTTASSLESFGEVIRCHPGGRMLVSTVDAWCVEADFVRFVERCRPAPRGRDGAGRHAAGRRRKAAARSSWLRTGG